MNNVIDSVDYFLISGFNFEFKMRSCFFFLILYLAFQVKKMENPEILFEQEKKCPPISVSLENISDINSCDNSDLKVTGTGWC